MTDIGTFGTKAHAAFSAAYATAGEGSLGVKVKQHWRVECFGRCSCGWGKGHHAEHRGADESWKELRGIDDNPVAPPCGEYDGSSKWAHEGDNLVVTEGLNSYLTNTLKTIPGSVTWYLGLVTGPGSGTTYAAGDVMNSHAGWTENTTYSNANRVTWTPGTVAAGSVDNSGSPAVFNINGTATIAGAFMTSNNTKAGTTGTLLGEGDFSIDRSVISGDTISTTVTCSIS